MPSTSVRKGSIKGPPESPWQASWIDSSSMAHNLNRALDMFSRIFWIRIYEFFSPISWKKKTKNMEKKAFLLSFEHFENQNKYYIIFGRNNSYIWVWKICELMSWAWPWMELCWRCWPLQMPLHNLHWFEPDWNMNRYLFV